MAKATTVADTLFKHKILSGPASAPDDAKLVRTLCVFKARVSLTSHLIEDRSTRFSNDEILAIFKSINDGEPPARGKAPELSARLLGKTHESRYEATYICKRFDSLAAMGMNGAEAYVLTYQDYLRDFGYTVEEARFSFDYAVSLIRTLIAGEQIAYVKCGVCSTNYLDAIGRPITRSRCPVCAKLRQAQEEAKKQSTLDLVPAPARQSQNSRRVPNEDQLQSAGNPVVVKDMELLLEMCRYKAGAKLITYLFSTRETALSNADVNTAYRVSLGEAPGKNSGYTVSGRRLGKTPEERMQASYICKKYMQLSEHGLGEIELYLQIYREYLADFGYAKADDALLKFENAVMTIKSLKIGEEFTLAKCSTCNSDYLHRIGYPVNRRSCPVCTVLRKLDPSSDSADSIDVGPSKEVEVPPASSQDTASQTDEDQIMRRAM